MAARSKRIFLRLGRALLNGLQGCRVLFYRMGSAGVQVTGQPTRMQPLLCHGHGQIRFGKNVLLGYYPSPGFLQGLCFLDARQSTAEIVIGDDVALNNNFTAIAETGRIEIGTGCRVGPDVCVFDSDFHGLAVSDRNNAQAVGRADVTIAPDVFIGARATILKGVTIGKGSVIAAGAVVIRDVPPGVIAGGNPAKILRPL